MSLEEILALPTTTIIDVREPYEFTGGHVEGAINIPLGSVPQKLAEINDLSKPIILCCASGGRSGQATMFLNSSGINEAYNGGGWMSVDAAKMSIK